MEFSLKDIIDAVQYGFDYREKSQNDNKNVPIGNTLQWLMWKKELIKVPDEFKKFQNKQQPLPEQDQKFNKVIELIERELEKYEEGKAYSITNELWVDAEIQKRQKIAVNGLLEKIKEIK